MGLPFEFLVKGLQIGEIPSFADLESLIIKFQSTTNPNWAAIETCRTQGSNTLIKGEEFIAWKNANQLLLKWIEADESLSFNKIAQLNAVLKPEYLGQFRDHPIYAAMGEFLDFQDLPKILTYFDDHVFPTFSASHEPVIRAAMIYQAISTFHPFKDANGRTARLAADFELIRNGYLPFCFENPFDGMCAIKTNSPYINGTFGLQKAIKWLCNSYRLALTPV